MKFQLIVLGVCLIFYTYDSANFKKHQNQHHEKNATRYCALALLITGCAQQTFTVQNKPAAVAPKPLIISSFLELGRRKLSMQPKFVAAQKMLLKQKPSKHS